MIIKDKKDFVKKLIIGTFTAIPFLSSLISTIHLIDLFKLGNSDWMSITLAITFEVGSIASLLTLTILDKIKKNMVMSIFIILVLFQLIGNIYFSFDYINQHLKTNPGWLGSFQELVSYFVAGDVVLMKLIVSCLVGIPIPLISLFFLKSVVDYLKFEEPPKDAVNEGVNEGVNEPVKNTIPIGKIDINHKPEKAEESLKELVKLYNEDIELNNDKPLEKNIYNDETKNIKLMEPKFEEHPILDKDVEIIPKFKEDITSDIQVKFEPNFEDKVKIERDITLEPIFEDSPKMEIITSEDATIKFEESKREIEERFRDVRPVGPSNVSIYNNNNLQ